MDLSRPPLVVAFELSEKRKATVADALAGASLSYISPSSMKRPALKRCARRAVIPLVKNISSAGGLP
jgi:hypothetical protein